MSRALVAFCFALTFYCLGTTYFEAFVNYRTWPLFGPDEFRTVHRALTPLVVKVMLVPIGVYLASLVALVLVRPDELPPWFPLVSLTLVLVACVSSVLVQIPIQTALDNEGLSLPLIDRLISTDLVWRKLPLGANALLWLVALARR